MKINKNLNNIHFTGLRSTYEIKKGMKLKIIEEWIVEYPEGQNISGL